MPMRLPSTTNFSSSIRPIANASLARVRRGMARLRQVTDDGKNPRGWAWKRPTRCCRRSRTEEKFAEARSELATILPDIADGFATQASQTSDPTRKARVGQTRPARRSHCVNNPAYLPASLRKDREGHIGRIVDKLKAAERGIQQDQDLAAAVENIAAAAEKGNAAGAYELQAGLLPTRIRRWRPIRSWSPPFARSAKRSGSLSKSHPAGRRRSPPIILPAATAS